jgi:hypothetical protein
MPSGFQCFVCGKQFSTNEERIRHLEEESHDSMYDTATPQETEDTRRLKSLISEKLFWQFIENIVIASIIIFLGLAISL